MSEALTFGERLRLFRKSRKLKQAEIAKQLNISKNYEYMLERGRTPGRKVVAKFEELFRNYHEEMQPKVNASGVYTGLFGYMEFRAVIDALYNTREEVAALKAELAALRQEFQELIKNTGRAA